MVFPEDVPDLVSDDDEFYEDDDSDNEDDDDSDNEDNDDSDNEDDEDSDNEDNDDSDNEDDDDSDNEDDDDSDNEDDDNEDCDDGSDEDSTSCLQNKGTMEHFNEEPIPDIERGGVFQLISEAELLSSISILFKNTYGIEGLKTSRTVSKSAK